MKTTKMMLVLGLVAVMFIAHANAEYYNYSDFTITGTLAGTEGGGFPWAASDGAWEQGVGYAWTGKAIMKYDAETAANLTLSMPIANGTYDMTAVEVFTNNCATNPTFPIAVEDQDMTVIAWNTNAWVPNYYMGEIVVTDGQLDIVIGNAATGGLENRWLGLSGFELVLENPPFLLGDANGDGVVSAGDYAAVQANFGNTLASQSATTPEPATLGLLSVGLVALIRRRK